MHAAYMQTEAGFPIPRDDESGDEGGDDDDDMDGAAPPADCSGAIVVEESQALEDVDASAEHAAHETHQDAAHGSSSDLADLPAFNEMFSDAADGPTLPANETHQDVSHGSSLDLADGILAGQPSSSADPAKGAVPSGLAEAHDIDRSGLLEDGPQKVQLPRAGALDEPAIRNMVSSSGSSLEALLSLARVKLEATTLLLALCLACLYSCACKFQCRVVFFLKEGGETVQLSMLLQHQASERACGWSTSKPPGEIC